MERKWSVRQYQEGDEDRLIDLYKAVYSEREFDHLRWLRWWRWQYKQNPAGPGWIYLAEHDGKIVGQQAATPVLMKIGNEMATFFQPVDAMTHPAYRGQGIYQAIDLALFARAAENGSMGFSFANKLSHPIAIAKLPYFDIAQVPIMAKPLNWRNALKISIGRRLPALPDNLASESSSKTAETPFASGLTIREVSSFDDRVDGFWGRVRDRCRPLIAVRSKTYLNWRYSEVPDIKYTIYIVDNGPQIEGYLVMRRMEPMAPKTAAIFDILAQSRNGAEALITQAIACCKRKGVDIIYARMLADRTLRSAFKKSGFIPMPSFVRRSWLMGHSSSPAKTKLLKNPDNWFLQIGDSDTL